MSAAALVASLASGCSGERSAEAFCDTLRSEKERIRGQLDENVAAATATGDEFAQVLLGVGAGIQAIGELRTYFAKLAKVAPEEIRTEAEIVAERIGETTGAPDLSLEGLGSAIFNGIAISGQLQTMDAYARQHCGEGI